MAGADGKNRKRVFDEINITPLTDIFLVLLIIMMVVAPMVQQMRNDVHPPAINSGGPTARDDFSVDVTKDGKYFVDGVEAAEADLSRLLGDAAQRLDPKKLTVRADRSVNSHAVMNVFNAAQEAGFEKMQVVGEVKRDDKPQEPQQ
jgi:biopolymer transport protein ExbD/biopolymer transport protein TolR